MSKKTKVFVTFYILLGLIAIVGFIFSYIYTQSKVKNENELGQIGVYEAQKDANVYETENVISQNVEQGSKLIKKTVYRQCSHIITDESSISEEVLNMSQFEVQNYFNDWIIDSFSKNEIVLIREVNSVCPEHYILKDKDGRIAIYYQYPNIKLKEITNMYTSSLPRSDQEKLKSGIYIETNESLAQYLEDYGS